MLASAASVPAAVPRIAVAPDARPVDLALLLRHSYFT